MPDLRHNLVNAKKAGAPVLTPSTPNDSVVREGPEAMLPPALQRIEEAIGARLVARAPYRQAIASVGEHEPRIIEVNDLEKFKLAPRQTKGHELVHLWRANLPGPLQKMALPDNPKDPYNISNIDQLRAKGYTLATIPQEQAATIVQTYIADPAQRKRLQIWIDDMNTIPLSTMNPTEPGQKGIDTTPRVPPPPVEAYMDLKTLRAEAGKRAGR
jgi:hypothetical protein